MSTLTAAARDPEALTSAPRGCARRWLPWTLGVAALLVLVAVGAALAVRSWAVPSAPVCALCAPGSPPSPSPAADHLGSPGALAVPRQVRRAPIRSAGPGRPEWDPSGFSSPGMPLLRALPGPFAATQSLSEDVQGTLLLWQTLRGSVLPLPSPVLTFLSLQTSRAIYGQLVLREGECPEPLGSRSPAVETRAGGGGEVRTPGSTPGPSRAELSGHFFSESESPSASGFPFLTAFSAPIRASPVLPTSAQRALTPIHVLSRLQLNDGTLNWYSDPGITGVFLAQGLSYHEAQRELEVAVSGIYYVFLHLELKRVQSSSGKDEDSETVTVTLHLQPQGPAAFTLPVVLSSASSLAGGSQGLMLRLDARQRLSVRMSASQSVLDKSGRLSSWQISQGTLGLFLVAAED
ncbi:PREDICTED: uncharacterized protein LOC102846317 [Elephantulus edwardii]|uniref:uncharacterized protein LOC102846317 n=1 Tax=Elephantulus edwardii TaxID=28737 RepID=UPI0003F060ED|nr:PREDICTED: uncharacterized protein LOC102846317 [Elephantulus edwardii]